ncbi:hypothetical protein K0H71_15165 [Bacillus sp. IITD106]|nr:hypothetical protein [Bacillus sp. IITD106]
MTSFQAQVIQNIPANRLVALAGMGSVDNREYDKIYLKKSELGWLPDFVTSVDLEEGQEVGVVIRNNPIWDVEAAQRLPAGTLVMCDEEGRVKSYNPSQGNHIGYTTHEVEAGEVVSIVRKYGNMPQNQIEAAAFSAEDYQSEPEFNDLGDLTNAELKELLDKKGIEYKANATKAELIALLGGE